MNTLPNKPIIRCLFITNVLLRYRPIVFQGLQYQLGNFIKTFYVERTFISSFCSWSFAVEIWWQSTCIKRRLQIIAPEVTWSNPPGSWFIVRRIWWINKWQKTRVCVEDRNKSLDLSAPLYYFRKVLKMEPMGVLWCLMCEEYFRIFWIAKSFESISL